MSAATDPAFAAATRHLTAVGVFGHQTAAQSTAELLEAIATPLPEPDNTAIAAAMLQAAAHFHANAQPAQAAEAMALYEHFAATEVVAA